VAQGKKISDDFLLTELYFNCYIHETVSFAAQHLKQTIYGKIDYIKQQGGHRMKVILEIETEEDRRGLEELIKSVPGKIKMIDKKKRPMESLISFAEKNAYPVDKVIIPGRDERNER